MTYGEKFDMSEDLTQTMGVGSSSMGGASSAGSTGGGPTGWH